MVYVKSLIKGKEDLIAFQKLQYQYTIQTDTPVLLYYYGKYIAQTANENLRKHFLGSALSSLQECVRACLPPRYAKIYVYSQCDWHLVLDGTYLRTKERYWQRSLLLSTICQRIEERLKEIQVYCKVLGREQRIQFEVIAMSYI